MIVSYCIKMVDGRGGQGKGGERRRGKGKEAKGRGERRGEERGVSLSLAIHTQLLEALGCQSSGKEEASKWQRSSGVPSLARRKSGNTWCLGGRGNRKFFHIHFVRSYCPSWRCQCDIFFLHLLLLSSLFYYQSSLGRQITKTSSHHRIKTEKYRDDSPSCVKWLLTSYRDDPVSPSHTGILLSAQERENILNNSTFIPQRRPLLQEVRGAAHVR